jgi:undecaprenyl-diphosphatase
MTAFEAMILGAVQGLTEFLPVSSSGHLVLAKELLGLEIGEQGSASAVSVMVLVHLGSLVAIATVFRRDVAALLLPRRGFQQWGLLVIASIPAAVAGIGAKVMIPRWLDQYEGSPWVACIGLLVTSVVLFVLIYVLKKRADTPTDLSSAPEWRKLGRVEAKTAVGVGIAQMCAITPGVSRSGSTIATALLLGWGKDDAVRLSFLMGMIAIGGAGLIEARNISELEPVPAVSAFLSSLIFSLLGIWAIKAVVAKAKFGVFAVYTATVGVAGLVWLVLR